MKKKSILIGILLALSMGNAMSHSLPPVLTPLTEATTHSSTPQQTIQQTDTALINEAKAFLKLLQQNNGTALFNKMSAKMQSALSIERLNTLWSTLTMQCGAFKKVTDWEEQTIKEYTSVSAILTFENLSLTYFVTYSADNKVEGLFFKPVTVKKKK